PDQVTHLLQAHHSRALRDQQTNTKLNGRDIFDYALLFNHSQQIQVTIHCSPGREWHESWMKSHAKLAECFYDAEEIFARVSFVEKPQHGIIHGFDRTDHKKTTGIAKRGQAPLIFEQVLDLDCHVVRHARKFPVKCFREFHRVTNAVKEIRIAKGDMLRPRGHLAADVLHHYVATDDSKHSLVNGHDRAMPAKMFAPAARLRRTNDPEASARNDEMRVFLHRRHSRTIRHFELQPGHRHQGVGGLDG